MAIDESQDETSAGPVASFEERRPRCPTLHTPRLTLRMLRADDLEFLAFLDSSSDVMHFIHEGPLATEQARRFAGWEIDSAHFHWHFHKWLVERTEDRTRLGWVQLTKFRQGHRRNDLGDDIQIGYEFSPEHWGLGYATEACRAVVDHAFQRLTLDRLVAFVRPENERSQQVLKKLGFAHDGHCKDDGKNKCDFLVCRNREPPP